MTDAAEKDPVGPITASPEAAAKPDVSSATSKNAAATPSAAPAKKASVTPDDSPTGSKKASAEKKRKKPASGKKKRKKQSGEPVPLTNTPNGDLPAFLKSAQQPAYRAGQVRRWLYRDLASGFHEMSNLPAELRKKLAERYTPHGLLPGPIQQSEDGTHKFLFNTPDGAPVETVLLPRRRGYALCISSQSGCAMGCPFCATGTLGLIRNLTGGEIVDQFLRGRRHARALGSELESVIFMGMGEPLANMDNLEQAMGRLVADDYAGFGARRLTVSTIGLPNRIPRLALWPWQVGLAISLHTADDELRRQLIPASRVLPLPDLMRDSIAYQQTTSLRVTYEYILLGEVNDSADQARRLATLLQRQLCHVNLIPYNPVPGLPFVPSVAGRTARFRETLESRGIAVTVRKPRGRDISAACGQLAAVGVATRSSNPGR